MLREIFESNRHEIYVWWPTVKGDHQNCFVTNAKKLSELCSAVSDSLMFQELSELKICTIRGRKKDLKRLRDLLESSALQPECEISVSWSKKFEIG